MFGIGLPELTIILVIALVVFGARKLPNIGTGIGKRLTKKSDCAGHFHGKVPVPESQTEHLTTRNASYGVSSKLQFCEASLQFKRVEMASFPP